MPSFGSLGIGGVVAFVVGSVMLIDIDAPGFGIPWQLIGGVALAAASLLLLLIAMVARSRRRPVITGREEMVGSQAHVIEWRGGEGRVRIHGETLARPRARRAAAGRSRSGWSGSTA